MKSATLPSFWVEYRKLTNQIRERARKTYRLWADNPFHPSLRALIAMKESGRCE